MGNLVLSAVDRKGVTIGTDFRWPAAVSRVLIIACAVLASAMSAHAQGPNAQTGISFDIDAQPLADALVAYGAVTRLELFYDGSLALGRRSAAVKGVYTPLGGLQELLRGTGYTAQGAALPDTVTIVMAPTASSPSTLDPYEPFFAVLQARIGEVLCASEKPGSDGEQIVFSFWVDPGGSVTRTEMLGSAGSRARRIAIAAATRGLKIGARPPPGLPQPVTMAIFPPAAGETPGCVANRHHAAR